MINEKELKEAVELVKRENALDEVDNAINILCNLASQVLKVEGFPQKITPVLGVGSWKNRKLKLSEVEKAKNELINQCKLIVARDYIHKSKLLDSKEIIKILERPNLSDTAKIMADAIINRQVEKMEGTK